jgi:hypothetical protein
VAVHRVVGSIHPTICPNDDAPLKVPAGRSAFDV